MKNVLMCYDDALLIDLVRISLEDKGVHLVGTTSCEQIPGKVNLHHPVAVILDYNMVTQPSQEVKDLLKNKHIPVVIFSSALNGRKNTVEGVDYFVRKTPFGFEELEKVIEKVLAKQSLAA